MPSRKSRRKSDKSGRSRKTSCKLQGVVYKKKIHNNGKVDYRGSSVYKCGKNLYISPLSKSNKRKIGSMKEYIPSRWESIHSKSKKIERSRLKHVNKLVLGK